MTKGDYSRPAEKLSELLNIFDDYKKSLKEA